MATKIESLVCNGQPLVLVLLGDGSVLSQTRVQLHCDVERLVRKRVIVDALVKGLVLDGVRVGGHKVGDLRLEGIPSITGEGSGDVVIPRVENLVPEGVQLVNIVVILKREIVAAPVTIWELAVVAVLTVQRLDQVTNVVDDEAKGVRLGDVLIVVELIHEVNVYVTRLVIVTLFA